MAVTAPNGGVTYFLGLTPAQIAIIAGGMGNFSAGPLAPVTDITPADSGVAGNLTGTYYYKATYVTALGETNVSATAPSGVTVAAKQIDLSGIPISSDSTVTARKIYRTVGGGTEGTDPRTFFLVATISDNTTTTYRDNLADGSLGAVSPSVSTAAPYFYNSAGSLGYLVGNSLALGPLALNTKTGYADVAVGYAALSVNTTGKRNTAVGVYALTANTTGDLNVAIGTHALNSNVTSTENTAVGYGALFTGATLSGEPNTAIGSKALYFWNSANGGNTAIGKAAGYSVTTGYNNTCIGGYAGQNIGAGNSNLFLGYATGIGSAGSENTLIGTGVGPSWTSGSNNTVIGRNGMNAQVSGGSNVAIGYSAGKYATASNELYIDNQDRTNTAGDKAKALMYGVFAAAAANQTLKINAAVTKLVTTVGGLPAAATVGVGAEAFVTDALAPTFGATVVASGAVAVPVYSDGTVWKVG